MAKIDDDIKMAHTLINKEERFTPYFWHFYRLWAFTTINMKEYLSHFDLKDKKCACIQGSSDHIFEIFLQKPMSIIGVDTNPLTGHYGELKIATFKALATPNEFLKFFRWYDYPMIFKTNKEAFDKDMFNEIKKYLSGDSYDFWEDLFKNFNPLKIRTNLFVANDEENNECLKNALSYLTPENYTYIHQNIASMDYKFMNVDIRNLPTILKDKQDFISLTNLIIYAHELYPDAPLHYFKCLIEDLATILSEEGKIMAGYLYDIENEEDGRDVYKSALREATFTGLNYNYQLVKRIHDMHYGDVSNNHDACLVYSKKQKKE